MSYLNTKPLIYGFEKGMMKEVIELVSDYPSRVASMLLQDEIDLGLIPVAVIPKLKDPHIVSNYCIGASGPVASVCLFSDVPVPEIKVVLLDYQSRTSAALVKILLKNYWKISPTFTDAQAGYEERVKGNTAALIIGDRALEQTPRFHYVYDLAEAWLAMTGLPFVFAAWVSNKKLPENFMRDFNNATGEGLKHIDEIVSQNPFTACDLKTYYSHNIDYNLDAAKMEGMKLFLEML